MVEVEFEAHLLDGGAAISEYSIEMDSGSGYRVVSPASVTLSPIQISEADIVSGLHITFRHRVQNAHGWSDYSDEVTIVAATVPEPPAGVLSFHQALSSKASLKWEEPLNTGGDAVLIEEYSVFILN